MHYLNVQGQHQLRFSDKVQLTLGGQADRRAVRSNDRGDHAHVAPGALPWPASRPRPA